MLIVLMLFCAAGAVFLIGLGAYAEVRELWTHPDQRVDAATPHTVRPVQNGPPRRI